MAKSGYVPQAVVLSLNEEEPTFILRRQDAPAAVHQTFMDRGKIIGYAETLIGNPDNDGFDAVIDFLNELDGAAKRCWGAAWVSLGKISRQVQVAAARRSHCRLHPFCCPDPYDQVRSRDLDDA